MHCIFHHYKIIVFKRAYKHVTDAQGVYSKITLIGAYDSKIQK